MSDLLLIPVCIIAGNLLSRLKAFPENTSKVINTIIIYVCLPALTLYYIPQIELKKDLFFPAIIIWLIFPLSAAFFILLEKFFKWDRKTTGALILTGGLANTSFVGFPVLLALFGEEGLKIGVIIDQAGSFLVLSTLGVIVASVYSSGSYSFCMVVFKIKFNDTISPILQKLGAPTIILALISVGMQLKTRFDGLLWKELISGLIYKLFLAPAIIFLIAIILKVSGLIYQVSIIESAMPPMVMGSVLAVQFELNPKLANLMVGIGIPLSAATLALWWWVVN